VRHAKPRALPLPPPLLALLRRHHEARRVANRAAATAAEKDHAHALARDLKHGVRALKRATVRARVAQLHALRVGDPQRFFKAVDRLAPVNGHVDLGGGDARDVPEVPGEPPAFDRLLAAFVGENSAPGDTPLAATPAGAAWLEHVPVAPPAAAAHLDRPVSWEEVYNVLFPPRAHAPPLCCPATGAPDADCPLCSDYNATAHAWGGHRDQSNPAPHHSPTANTTAVNAPDDFGLHELRFARGATHAVTLTYRHSVAAALADCVNSFLRAGALPPDALISAVSTIPKPARAGAPPVDPALAPRRFITVGRSIPKVWDLVLAARLTHFGVRHNIVDPADQGAFIPLAHSGAHVYALVEHLRARARAGLSSFTCFFDVANAYGTVSVAALSVLLAHVGLPATLVDLIRHTGFNRRALLHVNGAVSDPIPVRRGLGAGSCVSPVLWDFFIGSLSRYVASQGAQLGHVGPTATGFTFTLVFADDVSAPRHSFADMERTVRAVEAWASAWGLELKAGANKTAWLHTPAPGPPALGPQRQLRLSDGTVIPQVDTYRYLGYAVDGPLGRDGLAQLVAHRLNGVFVQVWGYNSTLSRCDFVTTRQLFKTLCVGSIGYLLALLPVTGASLRVINKVLATAARRFLGLPATASTNLALAAAGFPDALYLLVSARAQFLLTLELTPYVTSPAARMYGATNVAYAPRARGVPPPWARETRAWFARLGLPAPHAVRRSLTSATAAATARRACALRDQRGAPPNAAELAHASRPTVDAKPLACAAALAFGFSYPAQLLGDGRQSPMSYGGIGGAGAALSLTTARIPGGGTPGLAALRLGAFALARAPWAPQGWAVGRGAGSDAFRAASRGRPCPLCVTAPPCTPFHVLCECTAMTAERVALDGSVLGLLTNLVGTLEIAARPYAVSGAVAVAAGATRAALAHRGAPVSDFLRLRLVLAAPWHAGAIDGVDSHVERALGGLFDVAVLPPQALHAVYNRWVTWSAARATTLLSAWRLRVEAV